MRHILGIETSCDDTSVAIVSEDHQIHANVVSSQYAQHAPFNGVVPEVASRAHLENLPRVFAAALSTGGKDLSDMNAVAVTAGPGLAGCLMVGVNFAKAVAFGAGIPLIGVNHIRGHVAALFLEHEPLLPALALIVSGGHTHLLLVERQRGLVLLTKTRDDAAGEAFDKLGKMLGLGFPGGPAVDRLAEAGDPKTFAFVQPKFSDGSHDYSFSGMKSAAARLIEKEPETFASPEAASVAHLCASFRAAVVKQLLDRVRLAIGIERPASLLLGGGVACNRALRKAFTRLGREFGLPAFISSPKLSTDNAAMIAAEGWHQLEKGRRDDWSLAADIRWKPYDSVRLL